MVELRGHLAPLITPFTDDGSGISEIRLARLVRRLVAQSVGGFVVCSETGEFTSLSFSERKQVLEIVVRECQGALPVLTNISTLNTSSSLDLAQHAHRHGAVAVVMMPPYYGSFTQVEIEWHYKSVSQYAEIPLVVVDPLRLIGPELEGRLLTLRSCTVAERPSKSDAFALGTGQVLSTWNLPLELTREAAEVLTELAKTFGGAKVIKTALDEMAIEMGQPRKPLQALDREARLQIEAIVAAAM